MLVAQNSLGSVCPVPLTVRGRTQIFTGKAVRIAISTVQCSALFGYCPDSSDKQRSFRYPQTTPPATATRRPSEGRAKQHQLAPDARRDGAVTLRGRQATRSTATPFRASFRRPPGQWLEMPRASCRRPLRRRRVMPVRARAAASLFPKKRARKRRRRRRRRRRVLEAVATATQPMTLRSTIEEILAPTRKSRPISSWRLRRGSPSGRRGSTRSRPTSTGSGC